MCKNTGDSNTQPLICYPNCKLSTGFSNISISVLKTGIITKAKGSAYIEQGQTKAICAVYGPREIPRRSDFSMRGILNCTLEHTPYAKERRKAPGSQKDDLEAEMSNAIGQALEATVCMVSFFDTKIKVCNLRRYFQFDSFSKHQSKSLSINFLNLKGILIWLFAFEDGTNLKILSEPKIVLNIRKEQF